MRSRQPAGSATTIARDHFPTIVEQDRKVRFPAAIAVPVIPGFSRKPGPLGRIPGANGVSSFFSLRAPARTAWCSSLGQEKLN